MISRPSFCPVAAENHEPVAIPGTLRPPVALSPGQLLEAISVYADAKNSWVGSSRDTLAATMGQPIFAQRK
jgi:hypothetical protein